MLLLGCTPSDGQLYALSAEAADLTSAAALCARVREPGLRSECAGQLGREHAEDPGVEAHCRAIEDARWRDECLFLLAEERWSAGDRDQATALCRSAGQFLGPCFMHLWAEHIGGLKKELPPEEAVAAFELALEWPQEHLDEDLERRAWGLYFRTGAGRVDLQDCSGERAAACRQGLRESVSRAINRHKGSGRLPCDAETPAERAEGLHGIVDYALTPAMDRWIQAALKPHCP